MWMYSIVPYTHSQFSIISEILEKDLSFVLIVIKFSFFALIKMFAQHHYSKARNQDGNKNQLS